MEAEQYICQYGAMRINGKLNFSYLTYLDKMESEALNLRVLLLDEARRFRFCLGVERCNA